jgi:Na+/proline symporter
MRRALLAFLVIIDWGVVIWAEDANPLWLFGYQIVTLIVAGGVVARRVRTETAFALIVVGIIVAVAVLTEFGAKRGDLDAGSVYAVLESILLVYPVLRLVLDRRVRAAESVDESVDSSEPK